MGDPGVNGRLVIRWIFRMWNVGVWTGSIRPRIATDGLNFECNNEPSGSIKCGDILD